MLSEIGDPGFMGGSESFEQAGVTDPELGGGEARGPESGGVRFGNGLSRRYPDWGGESGI